MRCKKEGYRSNQMRQEYERKRTNDQISRNDTYSKSSYKVGSEPESEDFWLRESEAVR